MKKLYYYLIAGISNIVQLGRRGNTLRSEPTHIEFRSPANSLLRVKVGNAVELTDAVSLNDLREKVLLNYGTPVQNISQLKAIPNAERRDKQIRYVEDLRSYYQFDAESNETVPNADDPNRVFLPNDLSNVNPGRWIQTRGRTEYHSDLLGIDEGDDHPQYQLRNERNSENGYPGLTSNREIEVLSVNIVSGLVSSFLKSIATVARTWNLPDANGTLTTEERLSTEVTAINDVLNNKENTLPTGTTGQFLNGLKEMVEVAWNFIEDKPITFPPDAHGHLTSEIMDLDETLAAKADLVAGKVPDSQLNLLFTKLADAPSSYSGQKSRIIKVKTDESGLEFGLANSTENYIDFPDAIGDPLSALGWNKYNDGATPPTNGGIGGGSLGLLSFNNLAYNSDPNYYFMTSEVGYGVSKEFTIGQIHKNSILEISFDYITTNNCDTFIYVYDIAKGELIHPTNNQLIFAHSFVNIERIGKFTCQFQTSTSLTYRILIHTRTAGASSLWFKNLKIWRPDTNFGSIITEPQLYIPNVTGYGAGTFTTNLYWWRVGSKLRIQGTFNHTGTPSTSVLSLTFPNGYVARDKGFDEPIGYGFRNVNGASANKHLSLVLDSSNRTRFNISLPHHAVGVSPFSDSVGANSITNANERIYIDLEVDIEGWGGTVQLSSQVGDGRLISGSFSGHTGVAFTPDVTTLKLNTLIKDSHGAYSPATGILTIPENGDYLFNCNYIIASAGSSTLLVWKNGISTGLRFNDINTSLGGGGTIFIPNLKVGDQITFRTGGSVTTSTHTSSNFSWFKLNLGSQAFAGEEFVGASCFSSSTQTSLTTQINFGAKLFDTHNAIVTGASWRFTAPQNGYYEIVLRISGSGNIHFHIFKNNSIFLPIARTETPGYATGSRVFYLLAGEFIDVRPSTSGTVNGNASASNIDASSIEIKKVN